MSLTQRTWLGATTDSGATKSGVPTSDDAGASSRSREPSDAKEANPKSVSLVRPSGVTSKFPGLTSRCTKPRAWA